MRALVFVALLAVLPIVGCPRKDDRPRAVDEELDAEDSGDRALDLPWSLPFLACRRALPSALHAATTLSPTCVYVVHDALLVDDGAVLTLEPGVRVELDVGALIDVRKGALVAKGTETAPIMFTASSPNPAAGAWFGLVFEDTTGARSLLDHVDIGFGGGDRGAHKAIASVVIAGHAGVDVGAAKIHDSGSKGIVMQPSIGHGGVISMP